MFWSTLLLFLSPPFPISLKKFFCVCVFWLCQVLVAAWNLLVVAYRLWFPDQRSNPGPLHWECGVLATGPPGKSLKLKFSWTFHILCGNLYSLCFLKHNKLHAPITRPLSWLFHLLRIHFSQLSGIHSLTAFSKAFLGALPSYTYLLSPFLLLFCSLTPLHSLTSCVSSAYCIY